MERMKELSKISQTAFDRIKTQMDLDGNEEALEFLKSMMVAYDDYLTYWEKQKLFKKEFGPLISKASLKEGEMHNKKLGELTNEFNSLFIDEDWKTNEFAKIMKDFLKP